MGIKKLNGHIFFKLAPRLFYLCLLKIAEHVSECIFEWIKYRIVIVSASEYTLLSYSNVSSVIPRGKHHFFQQIDFCKTVTTYL